MDNEKYDILLHVHSSTIQKSVTRRDLYQEETDWRTDNGGTVIPAARLRCPPANKTWPFGIRGRNRAQEEQPERVSSILDYHRDLASRSGHQHNCIAIAARDNTAAAILIAEICHTIPLSGCRSGRFCIASRSLLSTMLSHQSSNCFSSSAKCTIL